MTPTSNLERRLSAAGCAATAPMWGKIKAGSYGTSDGWNAWRRSDGTWNVRSPRGEYHRVGTYAAARDFVARTVTA